ncbi:Hypothetical predicted protein, partial [Scomber scombrus]
RLRLSFPSLRPAAQQRILQPRACTSFLLDQREKRKEKRERKRERKKERKKQRSRTVSSDLQRREKRKRENQSSWSTRPAAEMSDNEFIEERREDEMKEREKKEE